MVAFQAIARPNEPRITVLVEALVRACAELEYGTFLSYGDLRAILFEDPKGARGRSALSRARWRLVREHHKYLINVRGQGYTIAQPNEHAALSRRHRGAGLRSYRRALSTIVSTEMDKLTPSERQQAEEEANRARLMYALTVRLHKTKTVPRMDDVKMPSGKHLAKLLLLKK